MSRGLFNRRCSRLRDAHGQPAIDGHGLAGDVFICDEGENEIGDLFGGPLPVEGDAVIKVQAQLLLAHGGVEAGSDDARSDAIDANVVVREFTGECAGDLGQGSFCRLVGDIGHDTPDPGGG